MTLLFNYPVAVEYAPTCDHRSRSSLGVEISNRAIASNQIVCRGRISGGLVAPEAEIAVLDSEAHLLGKGPLLHAENIVPTPVN